MKVDRNCIFQNGRYDYVELDSFDFGYRISLFLGLIEKRRAATLNPNFNEVERISIKF